MAQLLNTKILTQERLLFEGQVKGIVAPAVNGYLGIKPKHAPLMAALGDGVLTIRLENENIYFAVSGGFLQVKSNRVIVLTGKAIPAADIDLAEAEKGVEELKLALEKGAGSSQERERLSRELEQARVCSRAARLIREY